MGNNHGWPHWMKRGCLIKMREVFELISAEEYLKRQEEDEKLCYNTAYVPSYDPGKMCVTTKANKIWWPTPMMIEMAEELAPIVEEDIDVLFGTCE